MHGGHPGGMSGSGQPCDGAFSHGPDSGYSQSDPGAGGATVATSSGGPGNNAASGNSGNNSIFADSLDTFHAEFITQPIDYPMDVSPPPPIHLTGGPPAPNCTSSGSPNCHPPMSPSLPSFLETYQHPTLEEQQASRYTFKQVKFIYSEKATKFAKSPPYFCLYVLWTKLRWRFCKILWPAQDIRTLNFIQ